MKVRFLIVALICALLVGCQQTEGPATQKDIDEINAEFKKNQTSEPDVPIELRNKGMAPGSLPNKGSSPGGMPKKGGK